jgi:hypothetical protein
MESLDSRLALLERRYRRSRLVSLASLALGLLGLGVAALRPMKRPEEGELVASRLTLRDAQGRTRLSLSAQDGSLVVNDVRGQPRALLGLDAEGSPRLRFASAEGATLAELTVYEGDAPRLSLGKPGGMEFFSVALLADGSSRLEFTGEGGRSRATLGADASGAPGLWLWDQQGQPRASLQLSPRDDASFVLEGRGGELFRAPLPQGP